MNQIVIEKLITIDDNGLPKAPTARQILDKDILELWSRDKTPNKEKYLKDAGVIYYLGDPKSPPRQQGYSDKEALQMAIDNFDLPKTYQPDNLVSKLIKRYYMNNITEAGIALEALNRSIHLVSIAATKINELLNNKLAVGISEEEINSTLMLIDSVTKRISEIPNLTKALGVAYENLRNEEEEQIARGGKQILSSMDADESMN